MDLSRRSRIPPLIVFIVIICVHTSQARFYGDRQKRQNGANMYLPASSIVPGGEGNDPSEWTEWSSPSECSRTCGGGVSYQTRECQRTGPDGSAKCSGGNRKYFSCNTQDCPEEDGDFRAQQCTRYNRDAFDGILYEWVPYTNAPNPCELNCMPKGDRFYYRFKPKVADGTRCNDQDLNVCVDGQCQPVGCDMMLGSGAKEDSCRKCGGDGTTCRTVADRFTTRNLAAGYNDLLLIPSGATNIRIEETAPSNNYLACRNLSSHYYLNGNWRIDFPRPMLFAGSWWTYQRKPTGFAAPDHLTCRGPITESIFIVMLVQDKNVSIDYEYSIPQSAIPSTPDVYTWTHMEYGPCSASCGGGTQTRTVTCNNRLNLDEVAPSFCDEKAKPSESQECANEPCAPHWTTADWTKCSKGCGSDGIRNRTVSCERISPSGERTVEDDSVCLEQVGNKPANEQECNRDVKNCPKYHLGPWSPCDKLCGEGKQTRKVTCFIEENGRKKVLDDDDCIEEKPETEKTCMLSPCEGVDWIISQWSGCDDCGLTTETRTAICGSKSGKVYADEFCAPEVPLLSRPCQSKKCKTQWFTSEWSKCSSSCGKGVQSRIVLCGEYNGKTITKVNDDSKCNAATKPEDSQECEGEAKECPGQWFTGPWAPCSKPCGGGERQREVLCLANGTKSSSCDESKIESLSEKCNIQACTEDEIMPVSSTDSTVSDLEGLEECEDEGEDEDAKMVTVKMSADLKISDGIDLDKDSTFSTFMEDDDLMMSDGTPPTDIDDENSTDFPGEGSGEESGEGSGEGSADGTSESTDFTGSGDESSDTTQSSVTTDASASTDSTESSISTDSTVSTDSSISTDSSVSTDSTKSPGSTESTSKSSVSKDLAELPLSTESSSKSSDSSITTDSSLSTDTIEMSDSTESSVSTDSTESSISTDSTESSISTESTTKSSGPTDSSESSISTDATSKLSTVSSESTDSTESSVSTESNTKSSGPTDSTESSLSTDTTDLTSDVSTDSTESSVSTDSTSKSSISTDSTESSVSTDSTSEPTTQSSVSTDSTESSLSTDSTSEQSSISTDSTESSLSTDSTSDQSSVSTESTESSLSTESTSEQSTDSTESSLSTDSTSEQSSISSDSTEASSSTESTSEKSSISTDSTESSLSTDSTSEQSSISTDSTESSLSTDSTSEQSSISTDSTESSPSTDTSSEQSSLSTDSTESSPSTDSSSEQSSISTDSTESSLSTDSTSEQSSISTDSTESSLSTDSTSEQSSISTDSTESSLSTDSTSEQSSLSTDSTESSLSTDSTSESSESTGSTESTTNISETTEASTATDVTGSTDASASTDVSQSTTDSSSTTDAGPTDDFTTSSEATESSTDSTTGVSDTTVSGSDSTDDTSESVSTEDGLSTLFGSTTESSSDASLSTEDLTTVDIWTTEDDDFIKSTPNTLESAITEESKRKKCIPKKTKDCKKTKYGCCPDGKHFAKGPFDEGCPIPKTCAETEFGCCHDNVSPAEGKNFKGCPKSQCPESLFGCCPDNFTAAEGDDNEGCPDPTTEPPTTTTEIPDEETTVEGETTVGEETTDIYETTTEAETTAEEESTDVSSSTTSAAPGAVQSCSFNEFGCCPDGETAATGENFAGCKNVDTDCRSSEFGCCRDGRSFASGPDHQGCAPCTSEQYGCCPDNETPAHGPLGEGCCTNSAYGCCEDKINNARGPNYEGCDCQYSPYGCCPDKKTAARGPSNEGCGCETSQFGCCPDKITSAQGPKFDGCACHTLQFGCCPDGITEAKGPHHYGCHCSQTDHKCCPDEKTPAKGPNFEGCTCLESKYGCCPDGVSSAEGNKFEGCENVKEPPQKACGLAKETGNCGNFSIRYFFDTSYGACAKFWYGGCDGNGNNFESESECKGTCQEFQDKKTCFLPKSSGPCGSSIVKWYFDAERGVCEQFRYGGCFGTSNRFDTREECQTLCSVSDTTPPCDQPVDEGPCEGNFERWFYDNQTDVCRPFRYGGCKGNKNNYPTEHACSYHCRQPGVHKDYCSLPKKTGDCSEKHPRWYYSGAENRCMPFYYSGCGGNKNSFPSLESCEDHCPKEVAKDICEIPAEVGQCTNYTSMWYYDTKDQRCRQFYYGGCGGSENKFASEESCIQRCEKIPEPKPAPVPVPAPAPQPQTPPAASTNICDEKQDQGPCDNYTLWWHFDRERGECHQFYYGGCEGNANRFISEEECAFQCKEVQRPQTPGAQEPTAPVEDNVCLLAPNAGDCDNYVEMWYFDSSQSSCVQFFYGGCGGNGNRFTSEQECSNRCVSNNDPEFGIRIDQEPEGDISPELDDSRKCFLPAAPGHCGGNELRWHYNSDDGVCDYFIYTGCEGNANNYASESECEDECFPVHETCQLPPLRGDCNETMIRWYYNANEGRCTEFEFTGCRGNRNNFVTEPECMARCGNGEPPAPTYSVCDLPLEAGECDNSTTAWHYDIDTMMCVAFTYTGCGGNGNRFQSKEQCERQCGEFKGVDVCNEDVATGPCRQWQTRFYFNKRSRTCEPFTYGGCQGTGNRFENRGECESLCIIGQEPTFTNTKDICKQPVDGGRCNGPSVTERRWYYDDSRGNCVSFIYSGCAGNQNNFRSYESCYSYCSKPEITNNEVLPTNRCEEYENECRILSCPYGVRHVAVDEECRRCECDNPCADYSCPAGEQCAVEVSTQRSGEFTPVCRPTNKPGICPHLSAQEGACGRECYTDADCRDDNKCCSNGCGFVCVRPAVPTIRTTAPTTPAPPLVYPGEVQASLSPKSKQELDIQTAVGGIAVLRCFATGNPAPNVTWSRSNIVVDTNQGRYVLTSSGDLTIVQVRQTDSGSYVCLASNGLGEPVRREIELEVTAPADLPAYVYGDRNVTQIVNLNRPAVVRCPAGGHPSPMVHWWRNRSRLPLVNNRFELARDYSLTFRSIQLSDLGPYTCEAWNRWSKRPASIKVTLVAIGPARATNNEDAQYLQYIVEPARAPVTHRPSYPFRPTRPPAVPPPNVVVPSAPTVPVNAVIGKDPHNKYTPGSSVVLSCSVRGFPTPDVSWIKDGLPLVANDRIQIISVGAPYRVIINNVSAADSGRYGCKAANAVSYSISEEMINIESTVPLNPECLDNEHFANCNLIVRGKYCQNKYYAKFCCRSCALAGQL